MQPFEYQRVEDPNAAIRAVSHSQNAKFIAGGTNLVDLMKQDVEKPARLIDVNHLQLAEIVELPDGGLRLGALARNSDTADPGAAAAVANAIYHATGKRIREAPITPDKLMA